MDGKYQVGSMSLFSALLLKISPLYLNMLLGFLAGKLLEMPRDAVARFMFYMISPLIMFNGILHTHLDLSVLSLPLLVFCISTSLCLIFYRFSKGLWKDSTANVLAFSAGSGNTGYFGLPLALFLFNDQGEGVYMMALLGVTIFENSIGFYIFAKGAHSPIECLRKLTRLPILHAFFIALFINYLKIPVPLIFNEFMCHIKGTYAVLGMMIIGLGLAGLHHFNLDLKFLSLSFLAKFVAWPLITFTLIAIDSAWLGIYTEDIHRALILLSIVPLGVNTVILATVLKTEPEKAASAVLLSTIFALVYIPFMAIYFIMKSTDFFGNFNCAV